MAASEAEREGFGLTVAFPVLKDRHADSRGRRPIDTVVLYRSMVKQRGNAMPMPAETDTTSPKHLRDKYAIVGVGEPTSTRGYQNTTRAPGTGAGRQSTDDAGLKPPHADGLPG